MNAAYLVKLHGKKLVGRKVFTEPYGEWPGGPAEVIELQPDRKHPEISFQVRHLLVDEIGKEGRWEIRVFEHEDVDLLPP